MFFRLFFYIYFYIQKTSQLLIINLITIMVRFKNMSHPELCSEGFSMIHMKHVSLFELNLRAY